MIRIHGMILQGPLGSTQHHLGSCLPWVSLTIIHKLGQQQNERPACRFQRNTWDIQYMYQPRVETLADIDLAAGQVSCQPCSFGDSCKQSLNLRGALGPDAQCRSCIRCLRASPPSLMTSQDESQFAKHLAHQAGARLWNNHACSSCTAHGGSWKRAHV